ncbi:hypothetical protein Q8A67_020735 [Cirrhinus molitorella]|uniref:Uncharacterized protein n=1 Tax=Cirrhinus molitorella TaxID=172907 RepID=A0AA88P5R1_9TELE|nr:hypothetical protein Q8A67_020735 [Cirrhinus molitorella]
MAFAARCPEESGEDRTRFVRIHREDLTPRSGSEVTTGVLDPSIAQTDKGTAHAHRATHTAKLPGKALDRQSHQGTATQGPSDKPKPQLPLEQTGTGTSESAEILRLLKELMQRKHDKRNRKDQEKPDSA